jgi:hypothetical protein
MIFTRSLNRTLGSQPNWRLALAGSPISRSTSAGASSGVNAGRTVASPGPVPEGFLAGTPHRVGLVGRDHVVVGRVLLQHQPHHLDVFLGVTPVALGVEIAEVQLLLQAHFDARGSARDLARDEGLPAARGFVVEQDAVAGVHAVGLAEIHRHPVGVHLGATVGAARPERAWFPSAALPALCRTSRRRNWPDSNRGFTPASRMASRIRTAPSPVMSPVYSGASKLTRTWL